MNHLYGERRYPHTYNNRTKYITFDLHSAMLKIWFHNCTGGKDQDILNPVRV